MKQKTHAEFVEQIKDGPFTAPAKYKKSKENKIISDDGITLEVDVSTKTHKGATMLIDKVDYYSIREVYNGRISCGKFGRSNTKYATICDGAKSNRIHRLIIDSDIIDHMNGNGLDNRRSNLRACTNTENSRNRKVNKNSSTGVSGVSFRNGTGKYVAQICVNGNRKYLGMFLTLESAAKARRDAELRYFGEFAPNNNGVEK